MMVHLTLNVTIFATRGEMPGEVEGQHIAEVTAMLRHFFVDISVENLCLVVERTGIERMLGIEGKSDVLHLIGSREIPCGRLMPTMFALHEVPTVISISSQRPFSKISLDADTTVEGCVGMAIVICKVEEAVDAAIEGGRKSFRHDLPTVVALDEEKAAFVVGIGLGHVEVSVPADVFLHVAVCIYPPVALQLAHEPWCGISQTKVVRGDAVRMDVRIAHQRLIGILLD